GFAPRRIHVLLWRGRPLGSVMSGRYWKQGSAGRLPPGPDVLVHTARLPEPDHSPPDLHRPEKALQLREHLPKSAQYKNRQKHVVYKPAPSYGLHSLR